MTYIFGTVTLDRSYVKTWLTNVKIDGQIRAVFWIIFSASVNEFEKYFTEVILGS